MKILKTRNGAEIQVDDEDHEWLEMIPWHINGYAKTHFGTGRTSIKIHLHKLVLGLHYHRSVMVDHIDRNPLNNQKSNLRIANRHQNGYNRKSAKNSSSKYLGVMKRYNGVWQAVITTNGVSKSIGTFPSEIDAAVSYDIMAKLLHGEFASLNFK